MHAWKGPGPWLIVGVVGAAALALWRRPEAGTGILRHDRLARAIATAEGWGVPGSLPRRANNPGSLVAPWLGYPGTGPANITVFPSASEGWAALDRQLDLIASGRSQQYSPTTTIREMGARWTATEHEQLAWSLNVASALGVPVETPLRAVL